MPGLRRLSPHPAEYDRLVDRAEQIAPLKAELESLRQRVTTLEQEVNRLRGKG